MLNFDDPDVMGIISESMSKEHANKIKLLTDQPEIEISEPCKNQLALINNPTDTLRISLHRPGAILEHIQMLT